MENVESQYFMSSSSDGNDFYVTSEVKSDFECNGYEIINWQDYLLKSVFIILWSLNYVLKYSDSITAMSL